MWKLFLEANKDNVQAATCKYHLYYKVFTREFNLGFGTPRTDICSYCEERQQRLKIEEDNVRRKTIVCELLIHRRRAKKFYELMHEPIIGDDKACFVFDMMQNQPLPRTALGEAFYSRQLWQYYLGIVRHYGPKSQQNKKDVAFYTWGESDAMRGSSQVCSALHHCLTEFCTLNPQIKEINLFCDGCSAQNKNYIMLAMLSTLAHVFNLTINITFPVRGHSYLPVDRVFGRVEKMLRKTEQVILPTEYHTIFEQVGHVYILGKDWCPYDWKVAARNHIKCKMEFNITDMKIITVTADNVACRTAYSSLSTCSHTMLKRGKRWSTLQPTQQALGHPVKHDKLRDVKTLLDKLGITAQHPAMTFWENVLSGNVGNVDVSHSSADTDSD